MRSLSSGKARNHFADTLNHVAYGSEHIAIKRSGKEPVYMIPAKDYDVVSKTFTAGRRSSRPSGSGETNDRLETRKIEL